MNKNLNHVEEKSIGLFQKIIFWFVIPLLFAIFIFLIVLSVAGIDVWSKIKDIGERAPVIAKVFQEKEELPKPEIYEQKIDELENEIQKQDSEIDQLQTQLSNKNQEIDRLIEEKKNLERSIEELSQIKEEQKRAFKEIIVTYESMNPKNVAAIILEMNDEEALKVLSNVHPETLAKILEKLPAEEAAKYSEMLSVNTNAR